MNVDRKTIFDYKMEGFPDCDSLLSRISFFESPSEDDEPIEEFNIEMGDIIVSASSCKGLYFIICLSMNISSCDFSLNTICSLSFAHTFSFIFAEIPVINQAITHIEMISDPIQTIKNTLRHQHEIHGFKSIGLVTYCKVICSIDSKGIDKFGIHSIAMDLINNYPEGETYYVVDIHPDFAMFDYYDSIKIFIVTDHEKLFPDEIPELIASMIEFKLNLQTIFMNNFDPYCEDVKE